MASTYTIWNTWNTTNTASYSNNDIWYSWGNSTTVTSLSIWYDWNRYGKYENTYIKKAASPPPAPIQGPGRSELRIIQRDIARETARHLLVEHLTEEQRKMFERHGYFFVRSQHGRRYKIRCDKNMHNIFEVDRKGREIKELCVYTTGDVPLEDNILAQKLALEFNEDELLRKANAWDLTNHRRLVSRENEMAFAA